MVFPNAIFFAKKNNFPFCQNDKDKTKQNKTRIKRKTRENVNRT